MPITTFLQEKVRDPRVKGAPFSDTVEENFSINFETSSNNPIDIELEFDPSFDNDSITFSFLTPSQRTHTFSTGSEGTVTFNGLRTNLNVTINYDGRRNFEITYTNSPFLDHGVGSDKDHGCLGSRGITGSVLMIIFQDRKSINGNVNETSNELS